MQGLFGEEIALCGQAGNGGGGFRRVGSHLRRLVGLLAEMDIEHRYAEPRGDSFPAHVPMASLKRAPQSDFPFVARRKIGMPAFAGKGMVALPIPIQSCLAKASAGGDHGLIAVGRGNAFL